MTDTARDETDDGEADDRETRDDEVDADPAEGAESRDETGEDDRGGTGEAGREETSDDGYDDVGDENPSTETSEDVHDGSSEDASSETSEDAHGGTGDDTDVETGDNGREGTGDEGSADWETGDAGDESGVRDLSSAATVTGATSEEEAALRRARAVGRLLDEAVRVPGTDFRVGIDPILGILPGAGDAVAAGLSLYPIVEAYRMDAPGGTLAKMVALVAVDAVVGSIPIVGPVFDAVWKANVWNVRALERHLEAD